MIPDIVKIIPWKRFDDAIEHSSRYDDGVLTSRFLDGDSSFVLRSGHGYDLRTGITVTIVWPDMQNMSFVAFSGAPIIDEDVAVMAFLRAPDMPLIVLVSGLKTGVQLRKVGFANVYIPSRGRRLQHDVCAIHDLGRLFAGGLDTAGYLGRAFQSPSA
jgi:hypothetical protein